MNNKFLYIIKSLVFMEKIIYEGRDDKFCTRYEFNRLLENMNVEEILETIDEYPQFEIYMLENVAIKCKHDLLSTGPPYPIEVTLFGKAENISDVEKIILEEVNKFKVSKEKSPKWNKLVGFEIDPLDSD